jgi:hypothetical protein
VNDLVQMLLNILSLPSLIDVSSLPSQGIAFFNEIGYSVVS